MRTIAFAIHWLLNFFRKCSISQSKESNLWHCYLTSVERKWYYTRPFEVSSYTKNHGGSILNGRQTLALLVQSEIVFLFSPNFKHLVWQDYESVRRNIVSFLASLCALNISHIFSCTGTLVNGSVQNYAQFPLTFLCGN